MRADGKAVVATSWDRALVWNLDDDRIIPLFGHNGFVNAGVFSPDGRWIATTGADSTTRVWEASSGRCLLEFSTPLVHPEAVAFSPDGKFIVVGSDNSAGIFACDICGSLEDLLKLANKRITRPLSLNEKQRFLGVSYSN